MKVTVLGTGAFGLALASVLIKNKNEVVMWTTFEEEKRELLEDGKSSKLEGYVFDKRISVTTSLEESIKGSKLIVIAIPTKFISGVCKELKKYLNQNQHICIASKGIEQGTCHFINEIVRKNIKTKNIGVISGPSFAIDLIKDIPAGVSVASKNKFTIKIIKQAFCNNLFKLEATRDIVGVELCGSIKNVIALTTGILSGMNYPISTQAFFITKSLNDIRNLIYSLGGNKKTILTLAGFGDIILTSISENSRNYRFGKLIGSNASLKEIEDYKNTTTVEGLYSLKSIHELVKKKKIKSPLISVIYKIVFENENVQNLIEYMLI